MKGLVTRAATSADLDGITALVGRPVALPTGAHEHLLVAVAQREAAEGVAPQLLATLRLVPAIGLHLPRLWYHVGSTVHAAQELGLFHHQRTLLLGHDHTGASELADIGWLGAALDLGTQAQALRLLVHSAWMLLGRQRQAYAPSVIVELPGLRDSAGQSPFWQGLGRHFYTGDPAAAAVRHGPVWRSHVAALLPRQPLVASFLTAAAQAAIGQVQPQALFLREVLESAGLRYSHHVNLEDAGPVLEAQTRSLPGVGQLRAYPLAATEPPPNAPTLLLQAGLDNAWRAVCAPAAIDDKQLRVSRHTRSQLALAPGERILAMPLTH